MHNVYIYDYKKRGEQIFDAIIRLRGSHFPVFIKEVSEEPNVYDENNMFGELSVPCVVFLHLGNGEKCGNIRSMEFYEKKLKNNKIGVVAYTGGAWDDCPMPDGFQECVEGEKWHCYLNRINRPGDLNLASFFQEWSKYPQAPPPFDALRLKNFNHLIALFIHHGSWR